jgi:hypothetical protein
MEDFRSGWMVTSKLIEYLEKSGERIMWHRTCSDRVRLYGEKECGSKKDTAFSSTSYTAYLQNGNISLWNSVYWRDSWNSFSLVFKRWQDIDIVPSPDLMTAHTSSPNTPLPSFHIRYGCDALYEEADAAFIDFIENGERLIPFWDNIGQESIDKYKQLLDQLREHKDERINGVS